ncbi:MAG: hypothetical protein ACREBW_04390, partial [Candidatus Micrarchaeaceae archaeon]
AHTSENTQIPIAQLGGWKGPQRAGGGDPCNGSQGAIQSSQIPPATGDFNTESNLWNPAYSKEQNTGLATERMLADMANDQQDYYGDPNGMQAAFEQIVNSMPAGLSGSAEATYIIQQLFAWGNDDVGTLSAALISTIDQLAGEIQSGNGSNIDWSAIGDYLSAQAAADANAMQANKLDMNGTGSSPCGDVNSALQGAKSSQRNNQRKANNALKRLDPHLKQPPLPPVRPAGRRGGNRAPTKFTAPNFSGLTATTSNVAMSHLGPHSVGLLHTPHPSLPIAKPMVQVTTRTKKITMPIKAFPSPLNAQTQAQIGAYTPDVSAIISKLDGDLFSVYTLAQIGIDFLIFLGLFGGLTRQDQEPPDLNDLTDDEKEEMLQMIFDSGFTGIYDSQVKNTAYYQLWQDIMGLYNQLQNWHHEKYGHDYPP